MRVYISGPGGVALCDHCGERIVFRKNYLERMDELRARAEKHQCDPEQVRLVKLAESANVEVDTLAVALGIDRDNFDGRPDVPEFIGWALKHGHTPQAIEAAILD